MSAHDQQRRGRKIAMSPAEVDDFLGSEKVCRVATIKSNGAPHVSPLWFVWTDGSLWLHTLTRAQRWADLQRDPRISVVVDGGVGYMELCGVELSGSVVGVGEVPRTGEPCDELVGVERLWSAKYGNGGPMQYDGAHAWLRLTPEKIASWDFRKMGG